MSPFTHMAELVRDHALQLIAVQGVERTLRHGDGGIGRRMPCGERVDAALSCSST